MLSPRMASDAVPPRPEDAMKEALLAVVQVWLDRLQSMGTITTFFVSIDSMLFALPARDPNKDQWTASDKFILACLGGSIIFHVCASIIAYISSFLLIRYRLIDAEKHETEVQGSGFKTNACKSSPPDKPTSKLYLGSTVSPPRSFYARDRSPRTDTQSVYQDLRSLVTVHQVHPFAWVRALRPPMRTSLLVAAPPEGGACAASVSSAEDAVATLHSMVRTLSRCHIVTGMLALVGFVLAVVGTLGYFYTGLPTSLGIFASVSLGLCLAAGMVAVA